VKDGQGRVLTYTVEIKETGDLEVDLSSLNKYEITTYFIWTQNFLAI